jgi:hypothetical protein
MSIAKGNAQDLSSHQWNDRLVLIQAKDETNQALKNQISELKKHTEGLEDRRIVVYQLIPGKYKRGLGDDAKWEVSDGISKKLKQSDTEFEIVLIGLDGGIKLRRNELLTCEELFRTIDQMPMRRSELKKDTLRNWRKL